MVPSNLQSSRSTSLVLVATTTILIVSGFIARNYEVAHPLKARNLIKWETAAHAAKLSKENGKPIMYCFTADWCGSCRNMELELFSQLGAAEQIGDNFICVKADLTGANEYPQEHQEDALLAENFHVTGMPALVVAKPGKADYKIETGFYSVTKSLRFLDSARKWLKTGTQNNEISWVLEDYAVKQARTSHKPLFMAYLGSFIPDFLSDHRVVTYINQNFVAVRYSDESMPDSERETLETRPGLMQRLKKEMRITMIPAFVIMPESGSNPSLMSGYVSTDMMLNLLKRSNKSYSLD